MKGVDLSNYALEDLLAFDDIFLDYFNNFLKNPAFPQQIQYNRYLGLFEEINPLQNSIIIIDRLPKRVTNRLASNFHLARVTSPSNNSSDGNNTPNLNETEQNKVFDWVRQERLPLFFRTDFFREFKLCKLLSRSLDEQRADSEASSQLIGGYSRQSPPISNTLSTEDHDGSTTLAGGGAGFEYASGSNLNESRTTANKNDFEIDFENSINNLDLPLLEKFNRVLFQRPGSRALSVPSYFPFASVNFSASSNLFANENAQNNKKSGTKSVKNSAKSNQTKQNQLKKQDNMTDLTKIDDPSAGNAKKGGSEKKTIGFLLNKSDETEDDEAKNKAHENFNKFVKQHEENEYKYASQNNLEDVTTTDEDEDQEDEEEDDDEDVETEDGNNNLKIDENLSFTEDDYETIEDFVENGKVHASINQYKQKFLGSVAGMNDFKDFLKHTSGNFLIKFWLDCEFYRDSMQDYDQIENMATRNRLFRDINEKYVFAFSKKVHKKISENYLSSSSLNHSIFDSIQYDILRRIRAYWVPRFILNKLKLLNKDYGAFPLPPLTPEYSRQSTYVSVPSTGKSISYLSPHDPNEELNSDQKSILYNKVKQALHADKEAGGPFLRYISGSNAENLPLILFWYDVCDFNEADSIGFDKNSRLQHAWAIYNSYLSPTARFNIGLPVEVSDEARKSLQILTNSVRNNSPAEIDSNLFKPVMEKIIPYLQESWIKFIKDDVLKYTQARLEAIVVKKDTEETNAEEELENKEFLEKIPDPDLVIENNQVYLRRPWIKQFLRGRDAEVVKPKKVLTEQERQARLQRIRIMERERQRALKVVLRREKQKRLGILPEEDKKEDSLLQSTITNIDSLKVEPTENVATTEKTEITEINEVIEPVKKKDEDEKIAEKIVSNAATNNKKKSKTFQTDRGSFFDKMISSNKNMVQLFRKNFVDNQQRDVLNKFNSFLDAKQYFELSDPIKKAAFGVNFMKTYLDKNSKKSILPLTDKLQHRLTQDLQLSSSKDVRSIPRPRSPFLKELSKELRPDLEDKYQKFCELKSTEHSLTSPEEFALMNQTELMVVLGDSFNPKNFDFDEQEKGEGKGSASKEDRAELLKQFYNWSIGKNGDVFYAFYAHLSEHGKKDGFPFLDKDLLFCIDTIRLKEINGDDVLKQKAQCVIDVYLDSAVPPSSQIDVNNDMLNKLTRSAQKVAQGTHAPTDLTIFEEAKIFLFKEILPYWAGFKSLAKIPNESPATKEDKKVRERLEDFLNMRNSSPSDFKLPPLSPRLRVSSPTIHRKKSSQQLESSLNIVFSIANGLKYCLNSELTPSMHPLAANKLDRKQSNSQFSVIAHSQKS